MRDNLFVRTLRNRFVPIVMVALLFGIAMICYDVMWVRPVYSSDENSKIVSINVEDTVIQRARDIADELADITVKNDADEYSVKVLEYSSAPLQAVSPNLVKDTLLAYAVGFFISLIAFMVRESHDDVMRVGTNVEDLGVNVIGDIPYVDERGAMIDEG